ncbi:MAG: AEC family transporter [Spirochaetales bacterium]
MILEILRPVGRLVVMTLAGFFIFKIRPIQRHLLKPAVFLIINVVFPLYFVHTLPSQWAAGIEAGWHWMLIFLLAYLVMLGAQIGMAKLLINRVGLFETEYPRELLVLFAMHNAGYIPIPIVAALAPPAVSVYMSFYLMTYVLLFFSVAVWILRGAAADAHADTEENEIGARPDANTRPSFRLNAPTVGILVGLIFAITGVYDLFPDWAKLPFRWASFIALDGIMVVLGAVLARVANTGFSYRKEFGGLVLAKMVIYPLIVIGVLLLIPLRGVRPEIASGIYLALVLEAAVPPATNILVVTQAYGTADQVKYAGSAVLFTYAAALVVMPVFLILARLIFG